MAALSQRRRSLSPWADESGISLVELLVVVVLLSTAFLALAQVATGGLLSLRSAADRTTAMGLATQTVEAGRAIPYEALLLDENVHAGICGADVAIDAAGTITEAVLCAPAASIGADLPYWGTNGPYDLETYVTTVPGYGNARRITALVSWEERGSVREIRTSTIVAQVDRG